MQHQPRILVIGDIMLDEYISGHVARISPEAPVPVVKVDKQWSTLGGAANVAANVAALGAKPILLGLVGTDAAATTVAQACQKAGITTALTSTSHPTIVKTRVVSGQQIVRFDREEQFTWNQEQTAAFTQHLQQHIQNCALVLVSDYAKGTITTALLKLIFRAAENENIRVLVDPKHADWSRYAGAFLVTPNMAELALTTNQENLPNEDNQVVQVCNHLRHKFQIQNIVATRSSYGMTLCSPSGILNIPTRAQEVYDVSGAGDTVLAAFGVALAENKSLAQSAFFANAAAGVVVSKQGTAVANRTELNEFLKQGQKQLTKDTLQAFKQKHKNKKIVFTNGCFDVLHQGHRKLLEQAHQLGDVLVVGLNSDASISRIKGPNRPINTQTQRIDALSALPQVDAVVVFDEDTPFALLQQLRPQILVKGGDYKPSQVVGKELVQEVVIIPLVQGVSTSNLLKK